VHGSEAYNRRDLDLAEEHFFLLKQGLEELSESPQDSLALLYLASLERKVEWFVDILAEERFFTESYAPIDLTLEEAYDSLQVRYGIPDFLLPALPPGPPGSLEELLALENERVDRWMTYFQGRGRPVFARWLGRHHRYGPILERVLDEEGLPPELAYLAMIESGLQAGVRSRAGAVGWWQFMRSTARHRGLQVDEWVDERKDIEMATRAAARHLELMHRMFQDWALALAAYNAGEYRIQRAVGLSGEADYWTMRLPRETRDYVPKFIAAARIAHDPTRFGFETPAGDTLAYDVLGLDDAYSLDQISKATAIPVSSLRELNPQLLAGVTPPGREGYRLRVPAGSADGARTALARIPEDERITWRKHRVRNGETLGALARHYNTSVSAIMQINGISNPRRVRAGRVLTIPYPRGVEVAGAPTASSPPAPGAKTYQVRRGDTLVAISRRTGVSVSELRRRNGIARDRIYPGQTLSLGGATETREGTYTVRPGDTLSTISRRLGVSLGDLLRWNDLSHRSKIYPGDRLRVGS
jgi:membrane-bound lytic murein transglycosylase D